MTIKKNMKGSLLARKLKVSDCFIPCPVESDDKLFPNGIFVFNITKLTAYIQGKPDELVPEKIVVEDNYNDFSTINEGHLDRVDLLKPIVMAEIAPGRFNLIDGHHRMERAHRMGVRELMAFKLRPDQHIKFMTERKGYMAYIEYWNDKLKRLN